MKTLRSFRLPTWTYTAGLILLISSVSFEVQAQSLSLDFGDAPDSYGTLLRSDGARHLPSYNISLGASTIGIDGSPDTENDGQPSNMADGDDKMDRDDEALNYALESVSPSKSTYTLTITVFNMSSTNVTASAWIDFNKDGIFTINERAQAVVPPVNVLPHYNGSPVKLTWNGLNGLTEGMTYARFRVAINAAEVENPTGYASSGEVEDYTIAIKDEYDFGDAPESYKTLLKDNGPRHLINANTLTFTSENSNAEDDGKPSVLADADQKELGVSFSFKLTSAKTAYSARVNIFNYTEANAMLSGWIDFNQNGTFDASERQQAVIAPGVNNLILTWNGLAGLSEGRTYARFRIASDEAEVADPTGRASNGAVEDYTLLIEPPQYDYGDAPNSYGTLLSSNGPRHFYDDEKVNLFLGSYVGPEPDGQPSVQADGDDYDPYYPYSPSANDDEDGLVTAPALTTTSTSCTAVILVKNASGSEATLSGWIDFNRNGIFEANERAQASVPYDYDTSYGISIRLVWNGLSNLVSGQTYMRFRIASNTAEIAEPTGTASNGEVEDYSLVIQNPQPVELVSFEGRWIEKQGSVLAWVTTWEKNNDYFEIQRSRDAQSFETIGRLAGKGTTSATQAYEYVDAQSSQAGALYYRLKQVDTDGKVSYSRIISVRHDPTVDLLVDVYPNPAGEQLTVRLSAKQLINRIRVYSVSSREVIDQLGSSEQLNLRSLAAGLYIIEVTTDAGAVIRQRFVKQ